MQDSEFEYDVFLSFASEDEELVRGMWQQLTQAGLRVFWSDAVLRDRVGASWFEVIQEAIERSRHLVWICSPASLASSWVKREYVAFFTHHHAPPNRLLVPVLTSAVRFADLPLFLRELQAVTISDPSAMNKLIRRLGGVDIERLKAELATYEAEVSVLRRDNAALRAQLAETTLATFTSSAGSSHASPVEKPGSYEGTGPPHGDTSTYPVAPGPSTEVPRRSDFVENLVNHIAQRAGLPPRAVGLRILFALLLVALALGECSR